MNIAFIGRYTEGQTGIVKSIHIGLLENGYNVYEINLAQRTELINNPYRNYGGHGPVFVKWEGIKDEIIEFKPDIILLCAGGLTFQEEELNQIKKYCTVISFTLSDPDVFPTVKEYADQFDVHTTNAKLAVGMYKEEGIENTVYLPFGIDSRFFRSRLPVKQYKADVSIIGHFRPNRLEIASALLEENFNLKIFGRDWPIKSEGPVIDEEWFKAMYSTKIIVNFPKTGAGYTNIKVGIFEAAATGRLIMTEYFEEMEEFFEYDKEIIGYKGKEDLIQKIHYYLENPTKLRAVGLAARRKCSLNHTWKKRLSSFFNSITIKTPERKWKEYKED